MSPDRPRWSQIHRRLRTLWASSAVLLVGVVATLAVAYYVRDAVGGRDRARFDDAVQRTQSAIEQRLRRYEDVLIGARALLASNQRVGRAEWASYASIVALSTRYAALEELGYVERVWADSADAQLSRYRAQGVPFLTLRPPGRRPEYFPIVLLEPVPPGKSDLFGYDLAVDPPRRAALEIARDTARPTASEAVGPTNAPPDGQGPRIVVFVPLYRDGQANATVDERRAALAGFVYGVYRVGPLLAGVTGEGAESVIHVQGYDGAEIRPERLLFGPSEGPADGRGVLTSTRIVEVAGRPWTLTFTTLPAFDLDSQRQLPLIVIGAGVVISGLLSGITWTQVLGRATAESMALSLRASEAALAQRTAEFEAIFRSLPLVALFIDQAGQIALAGPAITSLFGYQPTEILGWPPSDLLAEEVDPPIGTVDARSAWRQSLYRRKDGTVFMGERRSSTVTDETGARRGSLMLIADVSQRRLLESQLRQAQKLEALGQLAGGVAHDFNNVLSAILGFAELALIREDLVEPVRGYVDQINRAGERAAALTRQLLVFAHQQVLEPKVLDLNDLLTELLPMLRRVIREDVDLTLRLKPTPSLVRADPAELERVVVNLVANARDAMPEGGRLTIETTDVELDDTYASSHASVRVGPHVMLTVSDTGIGMDERTVARIFDPFFTTKSRGKGTGLGLATVYSVVQQSGGHIWVYSEPGRGTVFKVYLPRVPERARDVEDVPTLASEAATPDATILVVEDEEMVRGFVRDLLIMRGYRVLVTADGEEALRVAAEHDGPIDVLLSDVVMPGMSGRDVAQRLARFRPQTRVIFMSGYTDDTIVNHGVLDAGQMFLQKPFKSGELLALLREVVAHGRGSAVQV